VEGDAMARGSLLPPNALTGKTIAISVSDSPDIELLGFRSTHLQLALAEIARTVFVAGGRLLYGGDLRPGGHTEFLVHELSRYGRTKGTLTLCLAWSVHRRTALGSLETTDQRLGVRGELVALGSDGAPLDDWRAGRPAEALPDLPDVDKAASLTAMREYLCANEHARIAIGGRRRSGDVMPGVLEETQMSLARGHAVYLAGGFGGITLDMAAAIDPACADARPPAADAIGPRAAAALDEFATTARAAGGWAVLRNGLDDEENRLLSTTHRPREIAALVATGLGRLAA